MPARETQADEKLLKHCIRAVVRMDKTVLEVETISWPLPSRPVSKWITAGYLPRDTSQLSIDEALASLFKDQRFFCVCGECGLRYQRGKMMGETMCHGCPEECMGIVF
jgi:hypothetical protein